MRRWQPTLFFSFTILVGLARLFAYAGMPFAQELSLAAVVHYLALHAVTFALATFLVAALSRATATRAALVALYAQGVLFLAPFVDVGAGLSLSSYDGTYVGILGTPGAVVSSIAYGLVIAWGVWDTSLGGRRARRMNAVIAVIAGIGGLSLAAVPWPQSLLEPLPWGVHVVLAVYFGLLAAFLEHGAIRFANPTRHAAMWREVQPFANVGFALLPLIGIAAAARLAIPPGPGEPFQLVKIELPFAIGAASAAAALFIEWRLVRSRAWEPFHREAAAVAKGAALAASALLGVAPFLVAGLAGSLLWLSRSRWNPLAFGATAGLMVLLGDVTAAPHNFATAALGPVTFLLPIDQTAVPSALGVGLSSAVGVLVAAGSWLTSRTSASGTGPASS